MLSVSFVALIATSFVGHATGCGNPCDQETPLSFAVIALENYEATFGSAPPIRLSSGALAVDIRPLGDGAVECTTPPHVDPPVSLRCLVSFGGTLLIKMETVELELETPGYLSIAEIDLLDGSGPLFLDAAWSIGSIDDYGQQCGVTHQEITLVIDASKGQHGFA